MTTTKSSAVVTITKTTSNTSTWWLKDPLNPANNMPIYLIPGTFDTTSLDRQNVVQLLNRADPVVLSDVVQLPSMTMTMVFLTEAAYQKFENWRQLQRVGLWQGPNPVGHWYVRLGNTVDVKLDLASLRGWATPGLVKRAVDVTMQAVASP